jgi:hypothetical protein
MNKQVASALIDNAILDPRHRPHADSCAMIGDPQCREVDGSDGKQYQIEFEAYWDIPRKQNANVRVILSIDDGLSHPFSVP